MTTLSWRHDPDPYHVLPMAPLDPKESLTIIVSKLPRLKLLNVHMDLDAQHWLELRNAMRYMPNLTHLHFSCLTRPSYLTSIAPSLKYLPRLQQLSVTTAYPEHVCGKIIHDWDFQRNQALTHMVPNPLEIREEILEEIREFEEPWRVAAQSLIPFLTNHRDLRGNAISVPGFMLRPETIWAAEIDLLADM